MEPLGVDQEQLSRAVAIGLSGTIVIYAVISPIMGYFIARAIKQKWVFTMVTACMILTFILAGVGLSYGLPRLLPGVLTADQIAIISTAIAVGLSLSVAVYIRWYYTETDYRQLWLRELDSYEDELPFERKRREYMERRRENTGRGG